MPFTKENINTAYRAIARRLKEVEPEHVKYEAKYIINEYVAALANHAHYVGRSTYYKVPHAINALETTLRVSDHRGYSDRSYKSSAHANTGIEAADRLLKSEPERYVVSIEIVYDKYRRNYDYNIETDSDYSVTRIQFINITCVDQLEEAMAIIDSELLDLFYLEK